MKIANMTSPRAMHACGLHADHLVFVVGGAAAKYDDEAEITSEFLNLETLTWHEGPGIADASFGDRMVAWGDRTFLVGDKLIFELQCAGDDWEWVQVSKCSGWE